MTSTTEKKKPLLIFDINGTLCHRVSHKKWVFRPGTKEFMVWASENYTLAIFTSMIQKNCLLALKPISGIGFEFIWARDRCKLDPTKQEWETIKSLTDVWLFPDFNRAWNQTNTIIVDDSAEKHKYNDPKNIILISSWDGNPDEQFFETLQKKIKSSFDLLELTDTFEQIKLMDPIQ